MAGNPTDRAAGAVITAAYANQLRDQTVQKFADPAARAAAIPAPTEGLVSVVLSTDTVEVYSGSAWVPIGWYSGAGDAWTDYVPTFVASPNSPVMNLGTGAIQRGRYKKVGRTVHVNVRVQFGAAGYASSPSFVLGFPFTPQVASGEVVCTGFLYGGSPANNYAAGWRSDGLILVSGFTTVAGGGTPAGGWSSGHFVQFAGTYESAS